jgi:hypothetical protein
MAKQSEKKRDLMIQRVNLSESVLKYWEDNFKRTLNVAIHKFLLDESDLHVEFSVDIDENTRVFSIEGMTNEEFIILKEHELDEDVYWLCKYEYAQFLMGRFNKNIKYTESIDKKTKVKQFEFVEKNKTYTDSQLYLPNKVAKSKKTTEATEVDKNLENDAIGFLFEDEDYDNPDMKDNSFDDDDDSIDNNFNEED